MTDKVSGYYYHKLQKRAESGVNTELVIFPQELLEHEHNSSKRLALEILMFLTGAPDFQQNTDTALKILRSFLSPTFGLAERFPELAELVTAETKYPDRRRTAFLKAKWLPQVTNSEMRERYGLPNFQPTNYSPPIVLS